MGFLKDFLRDARKVNDKAISESEGSTSTSTKRCNASRDNPSYNSAMLERNANHKVCKCANLPKKDGQCNGTHLCNEWRCSNAIWI